VVASNTDTHTGAGFRAVAARRPLTVFLAVVFGIGWPILALPGLAHNRLIPAATCRRSHSPWPRSCWRCCLPPWGSPPPPTAAPGL
jgi:hypothetical protein